jgi:hypothetical protein
MAKIGLDICARKLATPGDLNYPSFSMVFNPGQNLVKYKRAVTNVGSSVDAVYEVKVNAPAGVKISVSPSKLVFDKENQTQTYVIKFSAAAGGADAYGSIEWSDGIHIVRSPIAVRWSSGFAASM